MDTIKEVSAQLSKLTDVGVSGAGLGDPRSGLRRYLLLKYFLVLVLPQGNELLLVIGALSSLHAALLLSSPRVSRKASSVLLGQLAWADMLLLGRWCLRALALALEEPEAPRHLAQALLVSSHRASLLLLSLLSLEALLVAHWATESMRLRTVHWARRGCALVWAVVLTELLLLQAVERGPALGRWTLLLGLAARACQLAAPVADTLSHCIQIALWLANTCVCCTFFHNSTPRRRRGLH